jgi:intracellular septation protein
MSKKPLSPLMKNLLEYGPLAIFFITFYLLKDQDVVVFGQTYSEFIAATGIFVPVLVIATFIGWLLSGEISRMQVVTVVLVVVFGGLSVALNDERFFKIKPTIIYLIFAAIMGFGLLRGTSYMETVLGQSLKMSHEGWMILARRITVFFVALALANELVWRTQSTETWVYFKTFGLSLAMFAFLISQFKVFAKYGDLNSDR